MELYELGDTEEAEDEAPSVPVVGKGTKHLTTSVFILTVAHWAGGDVELWDPDDHESRDVMQDIWDHIYKDRIEHEISSSGTVLKVLIFRDNAGLTPKAWTGMWRVSFTLQTFASHLNFTYNHVRIPNLDTKAIGAWATFTLAVTAVCCILQLVIDGKITFKIISETCSKCTKATKTGDADIWTPIIKKGEQFTFSKLVWGPMTQKFMQLIIVLPDEDFVSIVQEAQQYAKYLRSTGSSRMLCLMRTMDLLTCLHSIKVFHTTFACLDWLPLSTAFQAPCHNHPYSPIND
ncbi:uncharacterized protein BJ212DRAFT_1301014 [Suillus subaureus]|uniref:Uncharacterized protein n=1 Tax=Suillus subaureus TaxID=48587 RepID=A0A9P7JC15_9AGAM|nr:uncharacterized protein BJ212DRAFT_1301014 [Suillus subaureus]KAG1813634.1 hypothetical protein BJ212DRAFT_1301014 [Suillus subaureus]